REGEGEVVLPAPALRPDAAPVCLHQALGDVEAQAEAAGPGALGPLRAEEAIEEARQVGGIDGGALVRDVEEDVVCPWGEGEADLAAGGAVFLRVAEQVPEHLLEAEGIGVDERKGLAQLQDDGAAVLLPCEAIEELPDEDGRFQGAAL